MSDFLGNGLPRQVDNLMDLLYGAGVSSHATIIEQINYLLFIKALSKRDDDLIELGITDKDELVFDGDLKQYKWENLLLLNPEILFVALEKCYSKISESTTNKTVRLLFRNAHLKIYDKATLRRLVHEVDKFSEELNQKIRSGQKDIFGDMYEYLLSKLNQSGTAGQFRTPRHIIEFIVSVIDPQKGETILDPACGTAGFLVKSYENLAKKYTSEKFLKENSYSFNKLSTHEKQFLYNHTFTGFDSDEDMIKFGMMNLFLHGIENARLIRQNSLTDTAGNRDKWDIILANPPFSGKIDRESVAEDIQMDTGATEILFLRYMMDHLTERGRIGVIVPEGILFNSSNAHAHIREMLIENGLWAVISLPAGVFNPYAGVKTNILFLDKTRINTRDMLFVKIENDGYALGAQRKPQPDINDLPLVLKTITEYKKFMNGVDSNDPFVNFIKRNKDVGKNIVNIFNNYALVLKRKIIEDEGHNLMVEKYKEEVFQNKGNWSTVDLIRVCEIKKGASITRATLIKGNIPVIAGGQQPAYYHNKSNRKGDIITVSASGAYAGFINYFDSPIFASDCTTIKSKNENVLSTRFIYLILKNNQEYIYKLQKGMGQPHVYGKDLEKYKIPLPPIEIQQQIVAEIENYQNIIAGARKIIANWKPKIDINPDWRKAKLGELCKPEYGFTDTAKESGDTRFIRITDISSSGNLISENPKFINLTRESKKYLLKKGDLLVARTGATFGKTLLFQSSVSSVFASFLIRLSFPKELILPEYYWFFAQSDLYWKQANLLMSGGGQPQFNGGAIKQIEIPLPALEIQKKIVDKIVTERALIQSTEKLIELYEQKIKEKISEI